MPVSPARAAAFDILLRVEQENSYASELLHASRFSKLTSQDHALATELVMGVLRWRSLLDDELARFSSQKLGKLDAEVLTALRLGAYQLGFLDRMPARAAVHESVELMRSGRKRSAMTLVNAVLRKVGGHLEWIQQVRASLKNLDESPASGDRSAGSMAIMPPQTPSAHDYADRLAHPLWLVERWSRRFGWATARLICRHDQKIPVTAIRLRDPAAEKELRQAGITLLNGALLKSALQVESGEITRTQAFRTGRIAIQDEASQLVALLLGTRQAGRILDCCAAPGGKTSLLAERNPGATILAADLHPHRARLLRQLVPSQNVHVIAADARQLPVSQPFERVLLDVPCSGTGTLARHPEIKWRLQPQDLTALQARQIALLTAAMTHVAPGGRLLYSTCSLEHEENEAVVEKALQEKPGLRLLEGRQELERLQSQGELAWPDLDSLLSGPYLRTLPGVHACDGFFAALLEKA
jgi:16S rRNA (cytosine967-C5)-methyltransferase